MKDKWWYCDNCGQTTADAQVSDEGYYSVLKMSCPDESEIQFDISYLYTNDRMFFNKCSLLYVGRITNIFLFRERLG